MGTEGQACGCDAHPCYQVSCSWNASVTLCNDVRSLALHSGLELLSFDRCTEYIAYRHIGYRAYIIADAPVRESRAEHLL